MNRRDAAFNEVVQLLTRDIIATLGAAHADVVEHFASIAAGLERGYCGLLHRRGSGVLPGYIRGHNLARLPAPPEPPSQLR